MAVSQMEESHTVSSSWVMTARGSSAFGVNTHDFAPEVEMATSTKTGRCANCGLVMDGEIVTSRALHDAEPAGSVTRVVMPGGGVLGFGVAGTGLLTAEPVGVGAGGRAVTVAVLVGFASSPGPPGHTCTMIHATRNPAAKRSSHRRT